MKMEDIIKLIRELAKSQGFYGRLLASIAELSDEKYKELAELWESKNFADDLDFILYIEG